MSLTGWSMQMHGPIYWQADPMWDIQASLQADTPDHICLDTLGRTIARLSAPQSLEQMRSACVTAFSWTCCLQVLIIWC